jgi:tripartite-type tricarboxylate transporter receptor subunit TctC
MMFQRTLRDWSFSMTYEKSESTRPKTAEHPNRWRSILRALAAIGLFGATLSQPAGAQTGYPDRPIRLIVAFVPGGITDVIARLLSQQLSNSLGQSVFVDNKGGAAGELGAKLVSNANPDGYTLLVTTTAVAIRAAAQPSSSVNPSSQLVPLSLTASAPTIFTAKAPTPGKNLMEFVQTHKNGQLTFASAGTGTVEHLTAAYVFKEISDLRAVHVPYRSGGEVVEAVLGGQVDVAATPVATAMPLIQQGKLQPLAVASHKRVATLPNVPTLAEVGLIDIENSSWVAVFGPPGLPKPIVELLSTKLHAALQQPEFRKRLTDMGFDLPEIAQPQLVDSLGQEVTKWDEILKRTEITLE